MFQFSKAFWGRVCFCFAFISFCIFVNAFVETNFLQILLVTGVIGAIGYYVTENGIRNEQWSLKIVEPKIRKDLPTFSREEVEKRTSQATGIWMSFGNAVYDFTEYIQDHPGGSQILSGAGRSIDSFWRLYQQHQTQNVLDIAERYRVGNLDIASPTVSSSKAEFVKEEDSYYENEPIRHPAMLTNSIKPWCCEAPGYMIIDHFYTPNVLFFVRNHHAVPMVDSSKYELEISVDGIGEPRTLKYGNRRTSFNKIRMTSFAQYDNYAIGCAKWRGAKLRDVLCYAGLPDDYEKLRINYVIFQGMDVGPNGGPPFSVSIPIEKAMDPRGDCLLAYEMNGEPLSADHGYPVRGLIPGFVGFRSCKWLNKVRASRTDTDAVWQNSFYKVTPPRPDIQSFDFSKIPEAFGWPVQSLICTPTDGTVIEKGNRNVIVMGVAWVGFGQGIRRVDVSTDEGKTWEQAELEQLDQPMFRRWCWTRWKLVIQIPKTVKPGKSLEIRAKAVDDAYNSQPERLEDIWNLRGCMNNTHHRVKLTVGK